MAKKKPLTVFHIQARRSWWSGKAWGLCGAQFEGGKWERPPWFGSYIDCPKCAAIDRRQGK